MRKILTYIHLIVMFTAMSVPTAMAIEPAKTSSPQWLILVHDMTSSYEQLDEARQYWQTIVANETVMTKHKGVLINLYGHPVKLNINTKTRQYTYTKPAWQNKYCFEYIADRLVAAPLSKAAPQVLMGQKYLNQIGQMKREYFAEGDAEKGCNDDINAEIAYSLDPELAKTRKHQPIDEKYDQTFSTSKIINILGIYQNWISLEINTNDSHPKAAHPRHERDWKTYKQNIAGKYLMPFKAIQLPPAMVAQAVKTFNSAEDNSGYDNGKEPWPTKPSSARISAWLGRNPQYDHFVIKPAGGGVAVQFGLPNATQDARGTVYQVDSEPFALDPATTLRTKIFIAKHPHLINWGQVDFYTIAPDNSAIVYCRQSKLYWQTPGIKPKFLGTLHCPSGYQWLNLSTLTPGEKAPLLVPSKGSNNIQCEHRVNTDAAKCSHSNGSIYRAKDKFSLTPLTYAYLAVILVTNQKPTRGRAELKTINQEIIRNIFFIGSGKTAAPHDR